MSKSSLAISALRADTAVAYGSNPRNKLDSYRPERTMANAPVIVFFFGGNWVSGKPAALLIADDKDKLVHPERNTGRLAERLGASKVPVTERYFDGVNHVTLVASLSSTLSGLAPTLDAVTAFVNSDGGRLAP